MSGGLRFSTTDDDTLDIHNYSLVWGVWSYDNAIFSISWSTLVADFNADFEIKSNYTILVRTSDWGLTYDKQFTITINNTAETPTDITLSNSTLIENTASWTLVWDLSSTDQDAGDTFTYSLVAWTWSDDNASFSITWTWL